MHMIPTQGEVVELLRSTGALRDGHFEYSNGVHTNQHIETALALRSYASAKILSVALSRLLRANSELHAMMRELSIAAISTSGMPIAYGLAEVLQPGQVYWAEKKDPNTPMRFRPETGGAAGEKVLLVDDILRSGVLFAEARDLLERGGAKVVGLAVLFDIPTPATVDFGALPVYRLARLEPRAYREAGCCDLCGQGVLLQRIGRDPKWEEASVSFATA